MISSYDNETNNDSIVRIALYRTRQFTITVLQKYYRDCRIKFKHELILKYYIISYMADIQDLGLAASIDYLYLKVSKKRFFI